MVKKDILLEHSPFCPNITEADLQKLAEAEDDMPVGVWAAGALADAGLIKREGDRLSGAMR